MEKVCYFDKKTNNIIQKQTKKMKKERVDDQQVLGQLGEAEIKVDM